MFVCSPILSYHFYLVFCIRFVLPPQKTLADYSAYLIYLAVMLLIPPLYILYIIFISLHLPRGVTSFAVQTSQITQQQPKIWIPPSQQKQKRGNIFSITNPEDLLDFIIEDDRLCVGK